MTQRKHLITFLKEIVATLEKDPIVFEFEYNGVAHRGEAMPIPKTCDDNGICKQFEVTLDDESIGIIQRKEGLEDGTSHRQRSYQKQLQRKFHSGINKIRYA